MDYGYLPDVDGTLPNRNPDTGIRYGITSQHNLSSWVFDELCYEYAHACPNCGIDLDDDFESPGHCPDCSEEIQDGQDYGDEPISVTFNQDGVEGFLDSSGDFWVCLSPVKSKGRHCSPCAPGAVSIEPPTNDDYEELEERALYGIEAYGLPDEFWAVNEE